MKKYLIFLLLMLVAFACTQKPKTVVNKGFSQASYWVTAKDSGLKLSQGGDLKIDTLLQPDEHTPTVFIDDTHAYQEIVGIGGAFTDASAETFYKLPDDKQKEFLKAYFSPDSGIAYTLGRVNMNSCDFSSDMYTYVNENDTSLASFNLEHDKKYKIPFIQAAFKVAQKPLVMFGSPWSPPAWMKTNNDMLHGGELKPSCYQAWANYYVRFLDEYKKLGIPFWGFTVQNEPMAVQTWESCIYTAEQEAAFVKNHLGPTLAKGGWGDLKLMIWDHNRGIMYQRAKRIFDDPEVSKYVWGIGFHWYSGNHFDNVKVVHEAYPDKNILFTEGCLYPFNFDKIYEWQWGEEYGRSLINDFNNGSCGFTDWNLLLDETGGPNHVWNFCYAPIIADTRTGELHYMNSFYYIGHFSKFVKPGARRIACTSNSDDILATAFLNPDGSQVTVLMNQTDKSINGQIWKNGTIAKLTSPAHSIISVVSK